MITLHNILLMNAYLIYPKQLSELTTLMHGDQTIIEIPTNREQLTIDDNDVR